MKLFIYGNLQDPTKRQTDWVRGELRMGLRDDPAAQFSQSASTKVWGQVMYVTPTMMANFNTLEAPEYASTRVKLNDIEWVYTYEYTSTNFEMLEPITSGRFVPTPESEKESEADDEEIPGY